MEKAVSTTPSSPGPDPRLPLEPVVALKNIKNSPLRVAYIGMNDELLLTNEAFQATFGVFSSTSETPVILQVLHTSNHEAYFLAKQDLNETPGFTKTHEIACKKTDQTFENFFVSLCLVRSPDGAPQYMRAVFRNENEKRELDANNDKKPLHGSHMFVSTVDQNGVFTSCEGELSADLIPKVIGRHFTDVYEALPEAQERIRRAMQGERFDVETYWSGFWYHVWYRPLLDAEGKPAGALWTSQPIDHEKQRERQLKAAVEEQEKATRLREEMLSMAAHEIRGPLSTLSMRIQLLEMKIAAGENAAEVLEHARDLVDSGRKQIAHVSKLIERTLDVSRMKERGLTLECRPCDLVPLIREAAQRCSERTHNFLPQIEVIAPDSLVGYWDPLRMEQVIENLVSNALKYGERSPVTVRLEARENRAVLEVTDMGSGIPLEAREKLFERFERGPSNQGISGFGMGLYIVRQIVQAHGGTISVLSAPEQKGTTFTVDVPIVSSLPH